MTEIKCCLSPSDYHGRYTDYSAHGEVKTIPVPGLRLPRDIAYEVDHIIAEGKWGWFDRNEFFFAAVRMFLDAHNRHTMLEPEQAARVGRMLQSIQRVVQENQSVRERRRLVEELRLHGEELHQMVINSDLDGIISRLRYFGEVKASAPEVGIQRWIDQELLDEPRVAEAVSYLVARCARDHSHPCKKESCVYADMWNMFIEGSAGVDKPQRV